MRVKLTKEERNQVYKKGLQSFIIEDGGYICISCGSYIFKGCFISSEIALKMLPELRMFLAVGNRDTAHVKEMHFVENQEQAVLILLFCIEISSN